ncbi:hypothetical protein LPB72_19410 [Hydrogenophaga crassostreae]|uniref:MAPEG family protein n=1 Tax=Hydrogenophaga crassostreae TaxID=1763535 RepID=A0A167GQI6_9BURK|nr:MAPEG family protein [Hydrogenophaga crassostreae]AOW11668.1 hypothetical protein LPB072_01145 [Hydrogenophaga crassostreae]OAD39761.1 hypothetical protein LPB72_19410 [Hydrogenophaga crassostreae]
MPFVELVSVTAVLQFFFFGAMTGRARRDSGLKAPAMTGHDGFERMYRVQMNTMEMLVALLAGLLIAGKYWPEWLVGGLGVVYVVGRFIYWRAYVAQPSTRTLGFMLSMVPTLALLLLALVGIIQTWL